MNSQPRQLFLSIGLHLVALLLALFLGSRTTAPTLAVERPHVTLIAPSLARPVTPRPAPRERTPSVVEPPKLRPTARQFVAPTAQRTIPTPAKQPQIELTAPVFQPVAIARPMMEAPTALPPPPIVVGKLGDAASQPIASPTTSTVRAAGFASTLGAAATTEPSNNRIAAAGFSSSKADAARAAKQTSVAASGFKGASLADPAPAAATPRAISNTKPVEILSKPKPIYTDEARALRLEGEVVLEVLFTAAAEARVLRVVRGLGHGLDEAAVSAAAQIKFRPALQAGEPVDQTATIRIRFELAY